MAIEEDAIYLNFDEAVWLHFELMWAWQENQIGVDRRDLVESALGDPNRRRITLLPVLFGKPPRSASD